MVDKDPRRRTRPTALKWVSLGLLVLALLLLPVLALVWLVSSLGHALGADDVDPMYYPAFGSLGFVLPGFLVGIVAWVIGCVVQRDPRPARSRRAFLAATVAVTVALGCAAATWFPLVSRVSRHDALVSELGRLDRMMPAGYQLKESDDDGQPSTGFAEPERVWSAPKSRRPCEQLRSVLTRWAGQEPEVSPRHDGCALDTTRYDWDISVEVELDAEAWDYPDGRARIELESSPRG